MSSTLRLLLDFDEQYQRDQQQQAAFLHRRDRRFAQQQQTRHQPLTVTAWLQALHALDDRHRPPGADPRQRRWRQARWVFAGLGAGLGVAFMLGLLVYEGGRQINLTLLMALVALQCLFAMLTSLQAWLGWQPWRGFLGRSGGNDPLALLRPALSARIAHTGGLMFALGGLLALLVMVVVQDLAFGWSTTLQTSGQGYHTLVSTLAQPWQALWPEAVPSQALVNASRFYRLSDAGGSDPALLGSWWPFVLMLWLVYVLLPRLLLLLLAELQVRWQARRALQQHPGYGPLLYRFDTPWVETRGDEEAPRAPPATALALSPLPQSSTLIHWAGAGIASPSLAAALSSGLPPVQRRAGGKSSLEEDAATLKQVAQRGEPVILLARGWEPPTGELSDFLLDARQQWPAGTLIALVPMADEEGAPLRDNNLLAQWQRFVERHQDSHLLLCSPATEGQ